MVLSDKIQKQINVLNDKVNELSGYKSNDIHKHIADLQRYGFVVVGYKASCGTTHTTMKTYALWLKAVKLLAKENIQLSSENVKVNNGSPTSCGGFWNEVKYSLK